jgi:biotin operon repressor
MSTTYYFGKSETLEKFGAFELPVFKVDNQLEWVINGMSKGWKNLQPQWYNFLYQTSVKHHSIIDAKSRYTYGKGWNVENKGLTTTELIELKSFLKKIEKNKVTQRCILDRVIQGGFACEMIYDKAGVRVMPYHVDFSYIRESKPEYDKDGQLKPPLYFYTSDWKAQRPKDNKDFVVFHPFDVNEKPDKSKRYLVYYKDYRPDLGAYPLPEYMGGLPYIQADAEVGNFVFNNVKQGFSAGYIINFFQDLNEQQQGEIERALIDRKHGSENAGNPLAAFNKPGDQPVSVTPIAPNGQDDRYFQLNQQIRDEIFTAHAISPLVVGMKGDNGFSNNADEIRTAVENFTEGYVKSAQDIFNEFMNGVIDFNEIKGNVYLQRLDPISEQLSEATLLQISTLDEIRQMAGLSKSVTESNKIADALKSLSPLVANKVLESMSAAEIRSLIGLDTTEPVVKTIVTQTKEFSAIGLNDDDYEVLDSFEYNFESIEDAIQRTSEFRMAFADKTEKAILGALNDNPKLKPKEIAEIIGKSLKEVNTAIKSLNDQGLLEGKGITPEGEGELEEFITVYKYVTRNDVPPVETTSRPFCKKYLALSQGRSFTIEDIQALSVQEGYDVFALRGGFYHNPDTDKTTPYCRHVFQARIVRLK